MIASNHEDFYASFATFVDGGGGIGADRVNEADETFKGEILNIFLGVGAGEAGLYLATRDGDNAIAATSKRFILGFDFCKVFVREEIYMATELADFFG